MSLSSSYPIKNKNSPHLRLKDFQTTKILLVYLSSFKIIIACVLGVPKSYQCLMKNTTQPFCSSFKVVYFQSSMK